METKKTKDIEKALFLNSKKLIIDGENVTATIIDDELDPINCSFNNDGCVEIDTKDYSYLSLSVDNLKQLIKLISLAEKHFEEIYKE